MRLLKRFLIQLYVLGLYLLETGISTRSVNRKITTLKSLFKFLLKEDIITENPTQKIVSPKTSKKLPIFLEESKMEDLFEEMNFPATFEGERDKFQF